VSRASLLHAVNAGGFPLVAPPAARGRAAGVEPSFSVVIAAFNAENTIAAALDSVRAQSLAAQQVVVCDDGSTDRTAEIVADAFPEVMLVRQENRGEGAARNTALACATTSHIVVLDADDTIESRCLEAYANALVTRPDLDVVTCDAFLEWDGVVFDRYYRRLARFAVDNQRLAALHQHFVFGFAAIRRTSLLAVGGWSIDRRRYADTDLFVRLILGGALVGLVYEPLARYRLRPGSLSDDRALGMRAMIEIVEEALSHPSISEDEKAAVLQDLHQKEKLTRLAELERALQRNEDVRFRGLQVARAGNLGYSIQVRARALAAAALPGFAAALLRSRRARRGITSLRIRTRNL
jgi:glycosyltransferase involved in cell wall biosynthesis